MILTLVWKELREHLAIWVAMALLSALLLIGLAFVLDPHGVELRSTVGDWRVVPVGWATFVLAVTYGLVCGAMMFAGEREGRTLPFLDSLPALRFEVWGSKTVTGLMLTLAQSAVLAGVIAVLDAQTGGLGGAAPWFVILPLVGVVAYGWGLFGSASSGSVLSAIGLGVGPTLFTLALGGLMLSVNQPVESVAYVVAVGLAVVGIVLSGLIFTHTDWDRWQASRERARRRSGEEAPAAPASASSWGSFPLKALLWLVLRQGWGELVGFAVFMTVLGLVLPSAGWVFWPAGTLLIGVLCGTAAFRPDQAEGGYRFLGEVRMPPWQVWLAKAGFWLAAALGLTLLYLLAASVHVASATWGLRDGQAERVWLGYVPGDRITNLDGGLVSYATLWLLHGYGVGLLCGLVWRKSAVAFVVALLTASVSAGLWAPSLLAGGLTWPQAVLGPVLLVAATFLAARAWLGDRLASWRPAGLLAGAAVAAAAWLGGNLLWRVVEVPDVGEPFDVKAFSASVTPDSQTETRALLGRALHQMTVREEELRDKTPTQPGGSAPGMPWGGGAPPVPMGGGVPGAPPGPPPFGGAPPVMPPLGAGPVEDGGPAAGGAGGDVPPPEPSNVVALVGVLREGWKSATPELAKWLDKMFAPPEGDDEGPRSWARDVREASRRPPAVVLDPRGVNITSSVQATVNAERAGELFVARGLQLLDRGKEAEGIDHLLTALGVSRHLRQKALGVSYGQGLRVERVALDALARWLEAGPHDRAVVARVKAELEKHQAELPPLADSVKAEYLSTQNTLANPERVAVLMSPAQPQDPHSPGAEMGRQLTVVATQMPWEKARQERLLNCAFAGSLRAAELPPDKFQADLGITSTTDRAKMGRPLFPWLPATKGPDAGLSQERLAALVRESNVLPYLPSFGQLFAGDLEGLNHLREVRKQTDEVLERMQK